MCFSWNKKKKKKSVKRDSNCRNDFNCQILAQTCIVPNASTRLNYIVFVIVVQFEVYITVMTTREGWEGGGGGGGCTPKYELYRYVPL